MAQQERIVPWSHEVQQQIGLRAGPHWHHFYSMDELENVLTVGTGFKHVHLTNDIYACVKKGDLTLPKTFNSGSYLEKNRDVRSGAMGADTHFLQYGWREGRKW